MAKIAGECRQVMDRTEMVAIVTQGDGDPHLVATWGDYVRTLGVTEETLYIPAYTYQTTEHNLQRNNRIELLIASKEVQRGSGKLGQGYRISGKGEIQTAGKMAEKAKAEFSGARGVLVVRVEQAEPLLK